MDDGRRTPPPLSGDLFGVPDAAGLGEASPLPRAAEMFVPQGTYGVGPHVPLTPYIPALPPALRAAQSRSNLRVVGEDPLAFLAKQTLQHRAESAPAPAPLVPLRRFRPPADSRQSASFYAADPPPRRDPNLGSVGPPAPKG